MLFFKNKTEKRAEEKNSSDLLVSMLTGNTKITVETAMQVPAVSRCVDMIASAAAELPIKLYRKKADGTVEEIQSDRRLDILNGDTGDTVNASDMRKLWVRDYLLKGSAFAYIERKYGVPDRLFYISPDDAAALKNDSDVIHKTFIYSVRGKTYQPFELLKILRNTDGFGKGKGIVEESPLIIETMYNLIKFQKNQVLRGGNKKGYLKSPIPAAKDVVANVKNGWSQLYNNENAESVMFLNGDIDFKEMSSTSVEMQLNESSASVNAEIMRLFGTADGMLSKDTVKNAVMPVIDTFEAAFDSDLLLEEEKRQGYYFAFDTRELTRGDIKERYAAYEIALRNNFLQLDEVRAMEDYKPYGANWIQLGLNTVLYDLNTGKIYTPNTNAFVDLGSGAGAVVDKSDNSTVSGEVRGNGENYTKGENGRFTGSTPAGGSSSSGAVNNNISGKGIDKNQNSGIIEKENTRFDFVEHSKHINYGNSENIYDNKELEAELKKSAIGRHTLEVINERAFYVEFDYDNRHYPSDQLGYQAFGTIHVNAGNLRTNEEVAKVIIHEATHAEYDTLVNTQKEEVFCKLNELRHVKNNVSLSDVKSAIKEVKSIEGYKEMKWRDKDGIKFGRNG